MESVIQQVRSERVQPLIQRTRLKIWFVTICASILTWTCLVQLWHLRVLSGFTSLTKLSVRVDETVHSPPPPLLPSKSLGDKEFTWLVDSFIVVNLRKRQASFFLLICDMVTVARLLNLTLVVPELDKSSFWADPSDFEDIFDVRHFIDSLRDEVRVIRRLPKNVARRYRYHPLVMPPVSWSSEKYYLHQDMAQLQLIEDMALNRNMWRTRIKILPLFSKHQVINFNRTDTRLANNGIPLEFQRLRCRVNFHALKFTPKIDVLGQKLVHILQQRGPFVALHLRYEMDMLAFSGCTQGCTEEEAEELKQLRYAFPWWKEKEIVSDEKRSQGLCPLTPEEATLILQALGIEKGMQIYIASGDIYGSERRLAALRTAFPNIGILKGSLAAGQSYGGISNVGISHEEIVLCYAGISY
ncbi:putative transmembrane emp24 domain-containing protein p24delta9-like [Capsicum annuum]|nr:putative transmembrane emp24 domain-containing protein p24delta9-like [Capsicum annuum]